MIVESTADLLFAGILRRHGVKHKKTLTVELLHLLNPLIMRPAPE